MDIMKYKRWKPGTFKVLKIKVFNDDLKNYKKVLKIKGVNMQRDFENHINSLIK